MTRDDVLNMPAGREIDALIYNKVLRKSDLLSHLENGEMTKSWRDGYGCENTFYSTDISAAWSLVEKFGLTVTQKNMKQFPERYIYSKWMVDTDLKDKHDFWMAWGETAPLAISRAVLISELCHD